MDAHAPARPVALHPRRRPLYQAVAAVVAVSVLVDLALLMVTEHFRRQLLAPATLDGPTVDLDTLIERWQVWMQVGLYVSLIVSLALAAAAGAVWREGRHRAALVAAALFLLHGAVAAYFGLVERTGPPSTLHQWLQLAYPLTLGGAFLGLVHAIRPAGRGRLALAVVGFFVLTAAIATALLTFGSYAELQSWVVRLSPIVMQLAVVAAAWTWARQPAGVVPAAVEGGYADAIRALDLLRWALVVRIGAAVLGPFVIRLGAPSGGRLLLVSAIGLGAGLLFFFALVRIIRLPGIFRAQGAAVTALLVLVCGVAIEIVSAARFGELLDMVEQVRGASSGWGMPSLSAMESLQASIRTLTLVSVVLGSALALTILWVLREAAAVHQARGAVSQASAAIALSLVAATLAFGALVMFTSPRGGADDGILLVGAVVLLLGFGLLAAWFGTLRELSLAFEEREAGQGALPRATLRGGNP